ncbi:YchJ family protein [Actinomycetes bacterium M1A6_2h]
MIEMPASCPCGAGPDFGSCCGPLLDGTMSAPTAERLMRSRFTAFARGDRDYLLRTWHPATRPRRLDLDDDQEWTRLEVRATTGGGMLHAEGTVDFVAHYRTGGTDGAMTQHSRFARVDGAWVYVD